MTKATVSPPWLICPECCALAPEHRSATEACGHDYSWIRSGTFPTFDASLTLDDLAKSADRHWRILLMASASWAGGSTQVHGSLRDRLVLPIPGTPRLQVEEREGRVQFDGPVSGPPRVIPCRFSLAEGIDVAIQMTALPGEGLRGPDSIERQTAEIPLKGHETTLGRSDKSTRQLPHLQVEMKHCVIAHQAGKTGNRFWLADCGSASGTFVNRQRIVVRRLFGGDLVQVGPYAWYFNETDGFLVPAEGIPGGTLTAADLTASGRLAIERLQVPAGQFVAVVGPSGAGKSSLIKAIVGLPGAENDGRVLLDSIDQDRESAQFRALLGYLSQEASIHEQLSPLQALSFNMRLRLRKHDSEEVKKILRQLEVPEHRWTAPIHELSGGEQKRVRIANELLIRPHLLLLDEPASGLDADREKSLMTILRSLSHQGCTVVLVTHGNAHQGLCDREIEVRGGRVVIDSLSPSSLQTATMNAAAEQKQSMPVSTHAPTAPSNRIDPSSSPRWLVIVQALVAWISSFVGQLGHAACEATEQFWVLCRREVHLHAKAWRTTVFPILVVPILFAVAISLSLQGSQKATLLGFLSILACIWMGASLSLLSIVGERETIDHEMLFYLRIPSYVAAKFFVFALISAIQSSCFLVVLCLLQTYSGKGPQLHHWLWIWTCLLAVGATGVGLGLLLSAVANRTKARANLLLPLIMMGQIVFSAQVVEEGDSLEIAYGRFGMHSCSIWPEHRAERWIPSQGGWISEAARTAFVRELDNLRANQQGDATRLSSAEERDQVRQRLHDQVNPEEYQRLLPSRPAAFLSFFTISRYGDIVLRSFAFDEGNSHDYLARSEEYAYGKWRRHAWIALGVIAFLLILGTTLVLQWQWSAVTFRRRGVAARSGSGQLTS